MGFTYGSEVGRVVRREGGRRERGFGGRGERGGGRCHVQNPHLRVRFLKIVYSLYMCVLNVPIVRWGNFVHFPFLFVFPVKNFGAQFLSNPLLLFFLLIIGYPSQFMRILTNFGALKITIRHNL